MPSFVALFSINFCIGGLPLQKKLSSLFQKPLWRRLTYFTAGMACGLLSVWSARQLVGTPTAEFFAATGLLAGRLFFPKKQWRQEDLRGAVVGTLFFLAPGLIFPLLGGWILFYLFTREAVPSSFLGTLFLIPASLYYYRSDLLFIYIFVLSLFFLAENIYHFDGKEGTRVAAAICFLPRIYSLSCGTRRVIRVALLAAVFLFVFGAFSLYRLVYSSLQQTAVFSCGNGEEKVVALTFDDGPDPQYTSGILDVLKDKNVHATFFVVGKQAERYPELLCRYLAEGHEIGNHTYTHSNLYRRTEEKVWSEMSRNSDTIEAITGQPPKYFRPPRGLYDKQVLAACSSLEQRLILWSISSEDWMEPSAKHIVRRISQKVHPGAIILFHDGGGFVHNYGGDRSNTVKALGQIVDILHAEGYRFVTITEMLAAEETPS